MPDTTSTRPLDAEREAMRAEGWSDEDIREFFIKRRLQAEAQPQAGAATGAGGVAPQGMYSQVLGSCLAVFVYVKDSLAAIPDHYGTLRNTQATAKEKRDAAGALIVKLALTGALIFAAWQEWNQHIIYQTEITRINVEKVRAENCSARMKALVDNMAFTDLDKETPPEVKQFELECNPYSRVAASPSRGAFPEPAFPIQQQPAPPTPPSKSVETQVTQLPPTESMGASIGKIAISIAVMIGLCFGAMALSIWANLTIAGYIAKKIIRRTQNSSVAAALSIAKKTALVSGIMTWIGGVGLPLYFIAPEQVAGLIPAALTCFVIGAVSYRFFEALSEKLEDAEAEKGWTA